MWTECKAHTPLFVSVVKVGVYMCIHCMINYVDVGILITY